MSDTDTVGSGAQSPLVKQAVATVLTFNSPGDVPADIRSEVATRVSFFDGRDVPADQIVYDECRCPG